MLHNFLSSACLNCFGKLEMPNFRTIKRHSINESIKRMATFKKIMKKSSHKPGTRSSQHVRPQIRVEKFSPEHRRKIGIGETRTIILFHKLNVFWIIFSFPMPPKPFGAKTRNCIHPPVHKNSELRIVVPGGKWPRIKRLPRRLIFRMCKKKL